MIQGNPRRRLVVPITILKDAAATSIYSVRAANGVFVITTKKDKNTGTASLCFSGMPENYGNKYGSDSVATTGLIFYGAMREN